MKLRAAERLLEALWRCYPPAFRRAHEKEMRQFVHRSLAVDSSWRALAAMLADASVSLCREWTDPLRRRRANDPLASSRPGEPMRNLFRDIRHAARLLGRSPGFTAAAIITLALGIGANTAMFTLADATLLRPLQVDDPERLVGWSWTSSYPDYAEYASRKDIFDGVAAVAGMSRLNLSVDGSSELASGALVSGNAFEVLGVAMAHGRSLLPSDDVANGPMVAVLSYDYWRARFGADPNVLGRPIRINGAPGTIVGVAEAGFRGTSLFSNPAIYLPTAVSPQISSGFFARVNVLTTRGFVWLSVIGRLRPGVSATQAAAAMDTLYTQLHPPEAGAREEKLRLDPLPTKALGAGAGDVRLFVTLLLGIVGVTLLIGCANLANLLLARATTRRKEIGVRLALGATRGRVVRQVMVESMLLAIAGGAAGIGVALIALEMLGQFQLPGGLDIRNLRLDINSSALLVTGALSVGTGLLFGALPAWRVSRTDLLLSLRDQSRNATPRSAVRSTLLAVQVALSLILLTGAGLFARSLMAALDVPLGFNVDRVITATMNLGLAKYSDPRAETFYAAALERVQALPQVESASWATMVPTRGAMTGHVTIDGYTPSPGEDTTVRNAHVGADYFRTVGTRLVAGRAIDTSDTAASPKVAVINEAMAKKYWSGRNPIGGRFLQYKSWVTVVGIVENTVGDGLRDAPPPYAYLAFPQWLTGRGGIATDTAHLFVKSREEIAPVIPLLRGELRALDPELPLFSVESFEERIRLLLMPQRMGVTLFALFGALAVTLAAVGIYGVSSYVAGQRTREIGVRIALGATRAGVRRLIVVQNLRPVSLGLITGLALALYGGRLVQTFLHGVSPTDPFTLVAVTAGLAGIAALATYVPARRASMIQPVQALRDD